MSQTVQTYLSAELADPYLDTNQKWRQSVLDHVDLVRVNSRTQDIAQGDLVQCTFKPAKYFRRIRIRDSLYWIIMLLNGWKCDADFNLDMPSRTIIIPSEDYLRTLYTKTMSAAS